MVFELSTTEIDCCKLTHEIFYSLDYNIHDIVIGIWRNIVMRITNNFGINITNF